MLRKTLMFFASFIVVGCATTNVNYIALSPEVRPRLQQRTITISQRQQPVFIASTPAKAMFGMVGVASQLSSGRKLVEQNQIADPAIDVAKSLLSILVAQHNMHITKSPRARPVKTNDVKRIAEQYASVDYVVDLQTSEWSVAYYPDNFNRYRVSYHARFTLIDTAKKQAVARGHCTYDPERTDNSPTYVQLTANGAALIRTELEAAAEFCAKKFNATVLGSQ